MIGGALDDAYRLKPWQQIIWPVCAALLVVASGVQVAYVTDPFGGLSKSVLYITPMIGGIVAFGWLMGMMYTTKLLDGVDGLVTGLVGIGSLVVGLFTLTTKYYQPDITLVAFILAAACAGFLVFNWSPAKIYLGDGGSLLLGYLLGVLAIISGGKIAIALLIMGVPILDVVWVIIRRLFNGQNPLRTADRKHLHQRLVDLGWGAKRTVLIYYTVSLVFGLSALFLQSQGKRLALLLVIILMTIVVIRFSLLDKPKQNP